MFRFDTCVCQLLLVLAPFAFTAQAQQGDDSTERDKANKRLLSIVDAVMENHLTPPTRQAMLHSGATFAHQANGELLLPDIGTELSRLTTRSEFEEFLNSMRDKLNDVASFDTSFSDGMLAVVKGDAQIIPAEKARIDGQLAANRYVGIGIALGMKESTPWIMKVLDGPGWKAGVRENDLILKIDGESTDGKPLTEIVNELRGEEGTQLDLVLKQPNSQPRDITVTRAKTFIPSVEGVRQINLREWQYRTNKDSDFVYIRLVRIGPSTVHELKKIEAKLRDRPIKGIIVDLRTGGGLLHDVVMVADQFLDGGTIGHMKTKSSMTTHKARQGCIFKDVPMAVLVSQDSGPDRIYLAAALQDSHRAVIVGQPTRMSAYVRSHVDLENGDRLVLATGVLKRANGTLLLRRSSKEQGIFINKFVNNRMKKPFKTSEINFVQPDHITSRTEGQLGALFPSANHTDRVHRGSQSIITKSIEILRNSAAQANKSLHQEATSG